jgi:acetyl esterase/lipase
MSAADIFPGAFSGGRLFVPPDEALPGLLAALAAQGERPLPASPQEFAAARLALEEMLAAALPGPYVPPEGVGIREAELDGVPALLFEPRRPRGALLHIHGGGWYMGSAAMMRPQLGRWCAELEVSIASLDYRLAPEHRCPAALDDCERGALAWLRQLPDALRGAPLLIAGESAGAHLAALTTIRLRRRHGLRAAGVALTYGLYDFANALPSRRIADAHTGLMGSRQCEFFAGTWLAHAAQAYDPEVSPLRAGLADLADLPPALFVGAGLDPFCDDSVLMHNRWLRAGNAAWLAVYEQAPHGFDMFGLPQGAHLDALRLEFLRAALEGRAA